MLVSNDFMPFAFFPALLSYGLPKHITVSLLAVTCLLITFANSLDPDQVRLNVGPDLDPKGLTQ